MYFTFAFVTVSSINVSLFSFFLKPSKLNNNPNGKQGLYFMELLSFISWYVEAFPILFWLLLHLTLLEKILQ